MSELYTSQTILIATLPLLFILVAMSTLPLTVECSTWLLPPWDLIIPIVFKFCSWVTVVPIVRSDIQRIAITGTFKDAGAALTNLFCKALVKGICSGLFQLGWIGLNLPKPFYPFIYIKPREIRYFQLTHNGPYRSNYLLSRDLGPIVNPWPLRTAG